MTAAATPPSATSTLGRPGSASDAPAPPDPDREPVSFDELAATGRAGRGDRAFGLVAGLSGVLVLVILLLIAIATTKEAWPAFASQGLSFLTSSEWAPNEGHFGALAFIYGTLLCSAIALVLAVPLSLGIALFTTEVAPRRLRSPIATVVDLLAAIPSVVYGLWGFLVLAPALEPVFQDIASSVGTWPVFGWFLGAPAYGTSFFTAGLILAFMITPIITSLTREVILTVPRQQREAALALGATRWEMISGAIIPWSRGGITGAVMLGLGRAFGETIAAALVIGASPQITAHLFSSGDAMAAVIANQFGQAEGNHRAALVGLGVVLFVITILVNMAATRIIGRVDRQMVR